MSNTPAKAIIQKFGMLTPTGNVRRVTSGDRLRVQWECSCDCGSIVWIFAHHIRSGRTRSCGCLKALPLAEKDKIPFNKLPEKKPIHPHLKSFQDRTKQEGKSTNLTEAEFFQIKKQPCHYCGALPHQESKTRSDKNRYNGIDRVNNDLGYIRGNVVPCCTNCNRAKFTMGEQEFYTWVKRLYRNLKAHNKI